MQLGRYVVEEEPIPVVAVLAKWVFADEVAQDFQEEGQVEAYFARLRGPIFCDFVETVLFKRFGLFGLFIELFQLKLDVYKRLNLLLNLVRNKIIEDYMQTFDIGDQDRHSLDGICLKVDLIYQLRVLN